MIIFLSILSAIIAISYPVFLYITTKMGLMTNAGTIIHAVYTFSLIFPTLKLLSFYIYIEKICKDIKKLNWKFNILNIFWFAFVEILIIIFNLFLGRLLYTQPSETSNLMLGPIISTIILLISTLLLEYILFFSHILNKIGINRKKSNYFTITLSINAAALIAAGTIFAILLSIISYDLSLFTTFE